MSPTAGRNYNRFEKFLPCLGKTLTNFKNASHSWENFNEFEKCLPSRLGENFYIQERYEFEKCLTRLGETLYCFLQFLKYFIMLT